jgi:predicted DNA-binding protein (MmcQ/YjbR family)
VREVCLSFPEAEEVVSHGFPDFRVRGKTFASYVVNHHGDGRVALWLNAPSGSQDHYSKSEPKHFFVPPYVGPRGWLGVHLNKGLSWQRIAALVRQSYEKVAPRTLAESIGDTVQIKPPAALSPQEIDPLKSRRAQTVLKGLRNLCLSWPEVVEDQQFGSPVWRAGKKTFVWLHADKSASASAGGGGDARARAGAAAKTAGRSVAKSAGRAASRRLHPRLQLYFWVGVAAQGFMTADPRFEIPPYIGHQGWIALDVTEHCDWKEVRGLALSSYRHFALQRMLKLLGAEKD